MKLRSIALASVAVIALSTPAVAGGPPGWYLGLGAGYDSLTTVAGHDATPVAVKQSYSGDALYLATIGYNWGSWGDWDNQIRMEAEIGFDQHDASKSVFFGTFTPPVVSGGTSTGSALFNVAWDFGLGGNWGATFGGGAGIAIVLTLQRRAEAGPHKQFADALSTRDGADADPPADVLKKIDDALR